MKGDFPDNRHFPDSPFDTISDSSNRHSLITQITRVRDNAISRFQILQLVRQTWPVPEEPEGTLMDLHRAHILVLDDLPDMADITAELVSIWGYDTKACYSGASALACARDRCPSVVILDLVMPQMDGFEFARMFRLIEGCTEVPLIAVSGYRSPALVARAREVGIDHYLFKPALPSHVRTLIQKVTQIEGNATSPFLGVRPSKALPTGLLCHSLNRAGAGKQLSRCHLRKRECQKL
jgi:CheY-like chemotaxis protein